MKKKNDKVLEVAQVFLLRGIDPKLIEKKYNQGHYKNLDIPEEKIEKAKSITKTNHQIGKDNQSEFYQYFDKNGETRTVVTTNQGFFFNEPINPKTRCIWCRKLLSSDSVGIPIDMTKEGEKIIFTIDKHCCCFECGYAFIKHVMSWSPSHRDPYYLNAEQYLLYLYQCMYPKNKDSLQARPVWWLYEENGGPLSDIEYHNNSHIYQKTTNIIFRQIKEEYIKFPRPDF